VGRFRVLGAAGAVLSLVFLGAACEPQPSPYLYDGAATTACLRERPEYTAQPNLNGLPTRLELQIASSGVYRRDLYLNKLLLSGVGIQPPAEAERVLKYLGIDLAAAAKDLVIPAGTARIDVFFVDQGSTTTYELFVFPSELAARHYSQSVETDQKHLAAAAKATERLPPLDVVLQAQRNVVILGQNAQGAPARFRAILVGCLKTRRQL